MKRMSSSKEVDIVCEDGTRVSSAFVGKKHAKHISRYCYIII